MIFAAVLIACVVELVNFYLRKAWYSTHPWTPEGSPVIAILFGLVGPLAWKLSPTRTWKDCELSFAYAAVGLGMALASLTFSLIFASRDQQALPFTAFLITGVGFLIMRSWHSAEERRNAG